MKNALLLLLLGLYSMSLTAQKNYFQQQVDYKIDVTLDDQHNRLNGQLKLVYLNLYGTQTTDLSGKFIAARTWS